MKIVNNLLNWTGSMHNQAIIAGGSLVTLSLVDVALRCLQSLAVSLLPPMSFSIPSLLGDMPTGKVLVQTGTVVLGLQALHYLRKLYQTREPPIESLISCFTGLKVSESNLLNISKLQSSVYQNLLIEPVKLILGSMITLCCLECIRRAVSYVPPFAALDTKVVSYLPELMTRVLEFLKTRSNNQLYTVIFACFAVYHPLNTILVACGIDIAKDSAVNQGTGMKSLGFSDTIFIFLKLFAQS